MDHDEDAAPTTNEKLVLPSWVGDGEDEKGRDQTTGSTLLDVGGVCYHHRGGSTMIMLCTTTLGELHVPSIASVTYEKRRGGEKGGREERGSTMANDFQTKKREKVTEERKGESSKFRELRAHYWLHGN